MFVSFSECWFNVTFLLCYSHLLAVRKYTWERATKTSSSKCDSRNEIYPSFSRKAVSIATTVSWSNESQASPSFYYAPHHQKYHADSCQMSLKRFSDTFISFAIILQPLLRIVCVAWLNSQATAATATNFSIHLSNSMDVHSILLTVKYISIKINKIDNKYDGDMMK